VSPSIEESTFIDRDASKIIALIELAVGAAEVFLPSAGVCRFLYLTDKTGIFLHPSLSYIIGARGVFEDELITVTRHLEYNKFVVVDSEKFKPFSPLVVRTSNGAYEYGDVLLVPELSMNDMIRAYKKMGAYPAEHNGDFFWHMPFWKDDEGALAMMPSHRVVKKDTLNFDFKRIPLRRAGANRNLHVGEVVEDTYGVQWILLGYRTKTSRQRGENVQVGLSIYAKNVFTSKEMLLAAEAFYPGLEVVLASDGP